MKTQNKSKATPKNADDLNETETEKKNDSDKSTHTKYSKGVQKKVEKVMREFKEGKLKTGTGAKVKDRKQAIAIGLSEAREKGERVPKKDN